MSKNFNGQTIIISGKQGAGKETQIKIIMEKIKGKTILYESGATLRAFSEKKDSPLSKKIYEMLQKGSFIPTWLVLHFFLDVLTKLKADENFILDGLPRDSKQAEIIDEAFELNQRENIKFLHLDISDKEAIRRITMRLYCNNCHKAHHVEDLSKENKCEKCGNILKRRTDDTPDALNRRLKWSNEKLKDVYKYYKDKRLYERIKGEQDIDGVSKDIEKALGL